MGTPEFPDLGRHCSVGDCKQIDFLPFTCDRCNQAFCLQHRSFASHSCPKADANDVTVVICPLCAKGVRLNPSEDPNITWESHVNTDCDPSNYERVTKKKRCPVPGCRETLTFSNTIKCRDCGVEHCLKHRFGPDHKCPGPAQRQPKASSNGAASWWSALRSSAEAGLQRLTIASMATQPGSSRGSTVEQCTQCPARFSTVSALIEHAERVHHGSNQRSGKGARTIDACPKCGRGFIDPVALVEHVERDHRGSSR